MVYQYDRIAVGDQIVHHIGQPHNIGRVQTDGRLIQHIQNACGTVADGTSQLHPLALAGRKGDRRPVQRQIPQSQVHQPLCHRPEGFADALRHGAHFLRQRVGNMIDPFHQLGQRHFARLRQRDAAELWLPCPLGQPASSAVRADALLQKAFHPFHACLVLNLGQGVFHSVDCIKISEVQLAGLVGSLCLIKDMLFLRRAVIDDFLFVVSQVPERHIRADAHFPADVRHQRPHQRFPWQNSALVNGQGVIRDQRRFVHRAHKPCAAAGRAGPLRVEGKLLRRRRIKPFSADRADQCLPRCHSKGRRQIVPVGAAVACKAREHQPQAAQQLRPGAEGASDTRNARTLVQCQRRRNVQHLIHLRPWCLRHSAPGIGGKCIQVPSGAFRIQHAKGKGRFAGTGHPCNAYDLIQRNIHINMF